MVQNVGRRLIRETVIDGDDNGADPEDAEVTLQESVVIVEQECDTISPPDVGPPERPADPVRSAIKLSERQEDLVLNDCDLIRCGR